MMPVYMDASQPRQMRPQGYYHQGYGNNPHHMPMDAPTQCYGSCVHGNFPAYNVYWPPCYPPQVPYHPHCMNHSGFHPHTSYAPPCYIQPPFPVGYQPWYDSDKDMSGKHQCGKCSQQICNPKNDRGVVIEEHEPEIEKGNHGTNSPYPIIWLPHENARSQEDQGSSVGSGNHDRPPAEVKAPENMAVQKSIPKSWFPFDESTIKSLVQNQDRKKAQNDKTIQLPLDISKLKSLVQGQDVKEAQIQKNKEEPGQLPYPIIWIPSHGKREDVEASENKESSDEGRNLKSFPTDLHVSQGQKIRNEGKEGNIECKVLADADEKTFMRNIPVESNPQGPRNIPVKLSENHMPKPTESTRGVAKNLPVKSTKKERSSSSPKASKLPPVCLRVDPLPKKKNGGSKSLSPPRRKEEPLSKPSSRLRSMEAERKTLSEACNVKCEELGKDRKMSEGRLNATGTEKESVESHSNLQEESNCEITRPCETKERGEKPGTKTFTEEEAARNIQSRYRGYDVRRWEPLKKLKEIATVREQMSDVKKRIQVLEVSTNQHIEEKEVVVLGEMVMNLLLKLDSIQGLHPGIRDYRKSLARELSDIQDKLDSLGKSSTMAEEEALKEQVKITSQTSGSPVNLEHSQLAEENKIVFDSDIERVLHPSPEKHPLSIMSVTNEQLAAEEGTGLFETLAADLEPVTGKGVYEAAPTSTHDFPVNLEHSQLAEEKQMVSDSNTENLLPSSEEHPMSVLNTTDEQLAAEAEDGSGLFEILASQPEAATETSIPDVDATLTSVPEKIGEVETVLPINAPFADEFGMRVTNSEEDKAVVRSLEEPPHELVQVVETTCRQGLNASEVCEAKANASENEDSKEDNVTILPAEKDMELSELPLGVSDDETQLLSQDSSACVSEAEMTGMAPETTRQERTGADHSSDSTQGIGQETYNEAQEEKDESPETEVIVKEQPRETQFTEHETPEEADKLMEENQRFKETMEALVKAGREQLEVISKLTGRVKSLEKKLSHKKRTQIKRRKSCRTAKPMPASSTDAVL